MSKDVKTVTERIIEAGEKAVNELIKILEMPIITTVDADSPILNITDLAADKMKNAAAAKRLAFEDALSITERIEKERSKILDSKNPEKEIGNESFAEKFAGRK